jgi:hypothetical protein
MVNDLLLMMELKWYIFIHFPGGFAASHLPVLRKLLVACWSFEQPRQALYNTQATFVLEPIREITFPVVFCVGRLTCLMKDNNL